MTTEGCLNCGDACGWHRVRLEADTFWGICMDCNSDGKKPQPKHWCLKCGQTFPICDCERGQA